VLIVNDPAIGYSGYPGELVGNGALLIQNVDNLDFLGQEIVGEQQPVTPLRRGFRTHEAEGAFPGKVAQIFHRFLKSLGIHIVRIVSNNKVL
jgi:hypothetical protein